VLLLPSVVLLRRKEPGSYRIMEPQTMAPSGWKVPPMSSRRWRMASTATMPLLPQPRPRAKIGISTARPGVDTPRTPPRLNGLPLLLLDFMLDDFDQRIDVIHDLLLCLFLITRRMVLRILSPLPEGIV